MLTIGLEVRASAIEHSAVDAERTLKSGSSGDYSPPRTLGGTGGSIALEVDDYRAGPRTD